MSEVGRFEIYNLRENPFPRSPFVNKSSTEDKLNGNIFEIAVREKEFAKIKKCFLNVPQSKPDHLRLGFINDTSYIGRGNGKSAFLINLLKKINQNYCLDLSENKNKCFGIFAAPEGGGVVKTFDKFVDLIFESILESDIIKVSLAIIRLDVLAKKGLHKIFSGKKFEDIIEDLNSSKWFQEQKIDFHELNKGIRANSYISAMPTEFPLFNEHGMFVNLSTQASFEEYYSRLRKNQDKLEFVFSQLVEFFLAAGFNGAYILVDDFERIPEFQSAIQKKDFATQLRTVLFDGVYVNSRIGFYNFFLALHAGVPRLLGTAWSESGMENRVPLNPQIETNNVIAFEKLSDKHAIMMIKKYLEHYRTKPPKKGDDLFPFTEKGVRIMGESSEYNAASILKFAYQVIEKGAVEKRQMLDEEYIQNFRKESKDFSIETTPKNLTTSSTTDLRKKAKSKRKK
ncbi:MAG: hypothetical protein KBF93_20045 [Leptospiraceae bacterium]|nr:hypothetical protein [Leptospiraceae bacterium]